MGDLFTTFKDFIPYIVIGLAVIILLLLILILTLISSINKLEKKYRKFMRGANNKSIEELVLSYQDKIDEAVRICDDTKKSVENVTAYLNGCLQKISIVRYKAFEDVGSDLSFSIAILDGNNDGIILTGIYGRNDSTTYAKPIDKGLSRYDLSEEEKQVLKEAMEKGM